MKNILKFLVIIVLTLSAFSFEIKKQSNKIVKKGTLEINAKSEINFWKNVTHSSFRIYLSNPSKTNSCEVYYVKNGIEKWISPSLLANKKIDFSLPKNAHLLIKNFSNENLEIAYLIK